jgi:multiple sugar transport system substrate-binding protein
MPSGEDPLVVLGREFEGFTRALDRQFGLLPGLPARHELVEISALERRVVDGDAATSGAVDVLMLNTDWLPNLIAQRRLRPLDGYLASAPPDGWPDAWVPSLRDLQRGPDGRQYGIAYHDGPVMLLYRTDLFSDPSELRGFEARFGYPLAPARTWDEFLDQARWFNRPADGMYGTILAGLPDAHNNIYDFLTQLWARGGDLLSAADGSALDGDTAREAIEFLHGLWHVHRVVDPAAAGWDSVASGVHFAAGEAAMMVNWCGFAAMSSDPGSPTHGRVGCAPAPAGPAPRGVRATMNSYWVLAIAAGCRRPGAAYELIRRIAAPEMDAITAESGGTATRRDTWNRPEITELAPYYAALEAAHSDARAIPRDPDWPLLADVLNDMMRAVVTEAAGTSALAVAHTRLTEILSDRRARPAARA